MSSAQITAWKPGTTLVCCVRGRRNVSTNELPANFKPFDSVSTRTQLLEKSGLKLKSSSFSKFTPVLKSRRFSPVCLSKTGGEDEGAPWKAFEKALGNITGGQSIEDVLKQQMQKKDYGGEGDSGGGFPPGGGGGGGGGDAEGLSGPEEEGFEELVQVFLATLGFIFLYIYILTGEELLKLFKDYIKYLFSGSESVRLKRAMAKWKKFLSGLFPKKVEVDPYWLEKAILRTTTLYDSPEKDRMIYDAMWAEQQKALESGEAEFDDDPKPKEEEEEDDEDR